MSDKRYLTIKQVADMVGVSRQAVYNQLSTKLKDYLLIVNGQKMIDSEALSEVYGLELDKLDSKEDLQNVNQMSSEIERLSKEIEFKNKEIERLYSMLEEHQRLLEQQQQVNMVQARQIMLLQAPAEEEEKESESDPGQEEKQEGTIVKHWWQFWR